MRQLATLTFVEIKLFLREPLTAVFSFAFPVFVLLVLGGVFGNTPPSTSKVWEGVGPMDYLVPGFFGLVMASVGFISLPIHLATYRERGILRRFRSSAVSPLALLASQLCISAVIAVVGSAAILVLGMGIDGAHGPLAPAGVLFAFALSRTLPRQSARRRASSGRVSFDRIDAMTRRRVSGSRWRRCTLGAYRAATSRATAVPNTMGAWCPSMSGSRRRG